MCVGSNEKQKNFDDKNIFILSYCIIAKAERKKLRRLFRQVLALMMLLNSQILSHKKQTLLQQQKQKGNRQERKKKIKSKPHLPLPVRVRVRLMVNFFPVPKILCW